MYFLSGDVSKAIITEEVTDPVVAYAPIVFWIIVIGIIIALGLLFQKIIKDQAKNRQSLQNIEYKLDKLIDVLEKKSN